MTHVQEGAVIACGNNESKREIEREGEGKRYEVLYQGLMKGKSCELRMSGREGRTWISIASEKAPRRLTVQRAN